MFKCFKFIDDMMKQLNEADEMPMEDDAEMGGDDAAIDAAKTAVLNDAKAYADGIVANLATGAVKTNADAIYSIQATILSGVYDEVMVSTDDEEIANLAKQAGASVPFLRSEKTSELFCGGIDRCRRDFIKGAAAFSAMAAVSSKGQTIPPEGA